jgi:hypothetical protein
MNRNKPNVWLAHFADLLDFARDQAGRELTPGELEKVFAVAIGSEAG